MKLPNLHFSLALMVACGLSMASATVQGQFINADSLLAIVSNTEKADTARINTLTQLQRFYFNRGLFDSTLKYARKALPIATRLTDNEYLARVNYNLGMSFTYLTQYDSARHYLDNAIVYVVRARNTALEINCYNALATLSNFQNDYSTAIEYLMKSIDLIDQSKSQEFNHWLPQAYLNLGHSLIAETQYERAIEYERKALLMHDYPNEDRYRVLLHLDIFDAYLKLNEPLAAKKHLDSAILLNESLNNVALSAMVKNNEGFYFQTINEFPIALAAYLQSYALCDSTKNLYLKAETADNISQLSYKTGNYKQAEKYANEANQIARQLKHYQVVTNTYHVLKNVAANTGDLKAALSFAELSKAYSDSALNEESRKKTLSLEAKYQSQKKEREIAGLTALTVQQELEAVKRNRLLAVGILVFIATLTIGGLLYRNIRQKQRLAEHEKTLQQERVKFLERQQQVVSLQSMVNGQEAERTRIAKDLHDGLGGLFSTVKMYFSKLQHDSPELTQHELFQKSYSLVDTASEEVRRVAHNMMPEVLMKLGLVNALKDLCNNVTAGKLLNVSLQVHGMSKRFNGTTEIMLFRIIQELLNNIIKHAHATEAIIQFIREDGRLSVVVEDNGRGFNTEDAEQQNHAGMATIQDRVNYLNGKLSIDSQKNIGTTVMMDFLIKESSDNPGRTEQKLS